MKSALIAGGGNKNEGFDYYPTPPEATHALMCFLKLPICEIWEPACGNGAMSDVMKEYGHKIISSDLRHTGYGEGGIDFLSGNRECDAVITNPPFGLAAEFIAHGLRNAETVAMLLKAHYWHAAKRKKLFEEHPPAWVLPLTWRPNFLEGRGKSPTMDFQWTVWRAGDKDTKYRLLGRDV